MVVKIAVQLFCVIVLFANVVQAQNDREEKAGEAEVLLEIEKYYQDFSARDWEAFAEHFWEDATLATIWPAPGENKPRVWVSTIPEFVAEAPNGPGSKPIFSERMTASEIKVKGRLAQVWAHYDAEFGDEGNVMKWSGIDAFTLLKFDGRWKIVSLSYVSD